MVEKLKMEQIKSHKVSYENNDSLTISSPAKGGEIKVYLDYNDVELCKKKIDNAIECREYANIKLKVNGVELK